MSQASPFRSGFVSLIGRPNVGKSCLLNYILGEKMAIVSSKPQTTRNKILGVKNVEEGQIIFLDTPGIHQSQSKLARYLVERSYETYNDADIILFVTDGHPKMRKEDEFILSTLKDVEAPLCLILNKIDLIRRKEELLPLIDDFHKLRSFEETFPLSALKGQNVERMLEGVRAMLPEGPRYFPEGMTTDQPERFIIAEFVREKIFERTRQEIPYSTAVEVEAIEPGEKEGVQVVAATIYVEKDSQKGVIIGKKGKMLQDIGKAAREEIERRLGGRVFLHLLVKVRKNWSTDEKSLFDFGYRD